MAGKPVAAALQSISSTQLRPFDLDAEVAGLKCRSILDPGAATSLLSEKMLARLTARNGPVTLLAPLFPSSSPLPIRGTALFSVSFAGVTVPAKLGVVPDLVSDLIIGNDILDTLTVLIGYDRGHRFVQVAGKERHNITPPPLVSAAALLTADITLPPRMCCVVEVYTPPTSSRPPMTGDVFFSPEIVIGREDKVAAPHLLVTAREGRAPVPLTNFSDQSVVLKEGTQLGFLSLAPRNVVASVVQPTSTVSPQAQPVANAPPSPSPSPVVELDINKDLPPTDRERLSSFLHQNNDLFDSDGPAGTAVGVTHEIHTSTERPVRIPPR